MPVIGANNKWHTATPHPSSHPHPHPHPHPCTTKQNKAWQQYCSLPDGIFCQFLWHLLFLVLVFFHYSVRNTAPPQTHTPHTYMHTHTHTTLLLPCWCYFWWLFVSKICFLSFGHFCSFVEIFSGSLIHPHTCTHIHTQKPALYFFLADGIFWCFYA